MHVLLIDNIKIKAKYRNQGIGSQAIQALLTAFPQCEWIVVKPFGTELAQIGREDSEDVVKTKRATYQKAEIRLRKFYERFGFRLLTRSHMIYNCELKRQPTVKQAEAFRKSLIAKARDEEEEDFQLPKMRLQERRSGRILLRDGRYRILRG